MPGCASLRGGVREVGALVESRRASRQGAEEQCGQHVRSMRQVLRARARVHTHMPPRRLRRDACGSSSRRTRGLLSTVRAKATCSTLSPSPSSFFLSACRVHFCSAAPSLPTASVSTTLSFSACDDLLIAAACGKRSSRARLWSMFLRGLRISLQMNGSFPNPQKTDLL